MEIKKFNNFDKVNENVDSAVENNKLIAEFMGFRSEHRRNIFLYPIPSVKTALVYELEYDKSWDWLMPVFEKINNLGYGSSIASGAKGYAVSIHIIDTSTSINFNNHNTSTKLEAGNKAVVEFIRWYNENNKGNGDQEV